MIYKVEYVYRDRHEWIRGGLFRRRDRSERVTCCRMVAKVGDASDLWQLVVLSDRLAVPIKWDYAAQTASILVSAER